MDPFNLLKRLKEDENENLEFVGATLAIKAKQMAFKSLFTCNSNKKQPKEFIAEIDKLFGRQELELEELKVESEIFETAKNARTF